MDENNNSLNHLIDKGEVDTLDVEVVKYLEKNGWVYYPKIGDKGFDAKAVAYIGKAVYHRMEKDKPYKLISVGSKKN